MSAPDVDARYLHELRGALNGLSLQLEVMALAFEREDRDLHRRALDAAREAVATMTRQIEALGSGRR